MPTTRIKEKVSELVNSQLPEFIRSDYTTFVAFLQYYYQFLEQDQGALELVQNARQYSDIDQTTESFVKYFLTNYAKFVSSGDTTSANNLIEIANYFGSNNDYAPSIRGFKNTNLDAKTINTAKEVISFTKMLDTQNSPDLAGVLLVANRDFLITTMLTNRDKIFNPETESDLTTSFFQSLKETFSKKSASIDNLTYSNFARNAITKFSNDLQSNGVVGPTSFTTVLVKDINRGNLRSFANDGVAKMQIDVFEGMLSFYQSQIQQENAKPEPNTSKIGQWQYQIT